MVSKILDDGLQWYRGDWTTAYYEYAGEEMWLRRRISFSDLSTARFVHWYLDVVFHFLTLALCVLCTGTET
jgi:hypothetical protein